jgi:hypothetical protein
MACCVQPHPADETSTGSESRISVIGARAAGPCWQNCRLRQEHRHRRSSVDTSSGRGSAVNLARVSSSTSQKSEADAVSGRPSLMRSASLDAATNP